MGLLSRKAACNTHGQDSSYFLGWQEYEKNPYDHLKNPSGIIQMGLAENQLSFDLLEKWLANNPDPARFKKDGQSIFRELALFQDYHGLPDFKKVSLHCVLIYSKIAVIVTTFLFNDNSNKFYRHWSISWRK